MMKHALKVGVAVVFCATAIACGDDGAGGGGSGGAAGVAGMTGGAGGTTGGAGGTTGGAGGMGGMTGGMGGMTGGMGGMAGAAGMSGGMGGMGGTPPTGDPTWTAIFTEVISQKRCNQGSQCHGGAGGNLMMMEKDAAYTALVGVDAMGTLMGFPNCSESGLKRVVPMDPDNSLLVQKLAGSPACGVQMPPGGPESLIPAEQLDQIKMWIMKGAPND